MSALVKSNPNTAKNTSEVTAISAVARVDYILRFSKHAVIVIDEQQSDYSSIGSQFLANLSESRNAAYLTMSSKLDDVQIRCRLIEQLFGQVLFDPEQSIAVSVVNLVKKQQQPLTIVVEHGHLLSFQLMHELCQLAEIAKKADLDVQVVLLAMPEIGIKMNEHPSLFHKKVSIVSASSGQLVSLSSKLLNATSSFKRYAPMLKWLSLFVLLSVVASVVVYSLYQRESFKFSKLPEQNLQVAHADDAGAEAFVELDIVPGDEALEATQTEASLSNTPINIVAASATEIANVLSVNPDEVIANEAEHNSEEVSQIKPASPSEIQSLLTLQETEDTGTIDVTPVNETVEKNDALETPRQTSAFNTGQGVVWQLAVIGQQDVANAFAQRYEPFVMQYQKRVNNKIVYVFTSKIAVDREQATSMFNEFPESLKAQGAFIKAVSVIKQEISVFINSHSERNNVTIPTS